MEKCPFRPTPPTPWHDRSKAEALRLTITLAAAVAAAEERGVARSKTSDATMLFRGSVPRGVVSEGMVGSVKPAEVLLLLLLLLLIGDEGAER